MSSAVDWSNRLAARTATGGGEITAILSLADAGDDGSPGGRGRDQLRLSFSRAGEPQIEEGIRRLAGLLRREGQPGGDPR